MKWLFIGDIVGSFGRLMVAKHLPKLKESLGLDFVIANAENASHGKGLMRKHYEELLASGIDVMTLGNHYNAKGEIRDYLDQTVSLVRPLNLKHPYPGVGTLVLKVQDQTIRVTNILGQAFMNEEVHNPFDALQNVIEKEPPTNLHVVDFHAEATGEKYAMGYAFSGKITALFGTHTHVQTNDLRLLDQTTLFISDVGMTGPYNGILGVKKENIIQRLWKQEKTVYELAEDGETVLSAIFVETNPQGLPVTFKTILLTDKVK
ncbi:MAG: TIGR00282 family metallophosphoesterase [Firmicutes bacterium]|nr:TIGR00282 family metallophosphoesterase [Bacillota bacterium]